ncbi:MAG: ABC transporter permease [Chitinophagaceae bacterium]|nr:ABC transporter permease [Chitinophagaceae bacterium]
MFRHNLLIAFRNLKRHKGSFLINLVGLSTGLACTFLIYLWVTDELNFDRFHKNDARLYQVMEKSTENGNVIVHESTQGPLAAAMKKDLPEVVAAVPVMSLDKYELKVPLKYEDKVVKTTGIFAGKEFFNVFSFELLSGNPDNVLQNKESFVVSENLANALFGSTEKAAGKNITWEIFGKKVNATVTGVVKNPPVNNSIKFDFAATSEMLMDDLFKNFQKWENTGPDTYLLLKEGTDAAQFNTKIAKFIDKYDGSNIFTLFVRPFSSGYLYARYENGVQSGGRIEYVRLFSLIAIFILVIACINFMNLSTAKASRRLKEVGIKKAIGSTRKTLILQFLSEAVFMALLSLIVAVAIVVAVLPVFNSITQKQLDINLNPRIISLALLTTLLTGLISGSYPAFYMSGFNVVSVFRGKLKKSVGELLARKGLVVFQFMVSLVMMVAVMIIAKQVKFVRTMNIGYDKSNVIHFDKDGSLVTSGNSFLSELKKIPGVVNSSTVITNIIQPGNGSSTYGLDWPGKSPDALIDFAIRDVDYDFIETLGMKMVDGRSFSREFGADDKKLILNETAIKMMGLKNPVGTRVKLWGEDRTIIGVVKDFHISSLHEPISPFIFKFDPSRTSTFMVKLAAGEEKKTISAIEELYHKFNPGFVFQYKYLDEVYQAQHVSESRVAEISKYFAALAIIISCLGLLGLSAFNAEVRTKEIGIRKVLGATVSNIMLLLSKDFFVLIVISMFIAFPIAWWAMNEWLAAFAYKIQIGAGVFVVSGLAMIVLTLVTVSFQSARAALMNPVKSLRTE